VFSQLLTLFITPVFYTYMEQFGGVSGKPRAARKKRQATPVAPLEEALKG
jgi:hypothetical protein